MRVWLLAGPGMHMRQRVRRRSAPDDAPGTRPLPPPPHTVAYGALSKIFPSFSLGAFPYFFNDN